MNLLRLLFILIYVSLCNIALTQEDTTTLFDLNIEDLMNIEASSASKFDEFIDEIPATILIISSENIKDRGYISLNEIIYDLPGFDVAAPYSDFTQMQYARGNRTGSYNERTIFLINGIEQNLLYCQGMNIAEDFPLSVIERIEVLYGPASAVYGPNAFSGIINVITKNASELGENEDNVSINIGAGNQSDTYADVTYLASYGQVGLLLSYRRFHSDRFDISDQPGFFANDSIIGNPRLWGPYADLYPKYQNRADDFGIIAKLNYKNIEIGFNKLETLHGNGSEYPYDRTLPTLSWNFFRDVIYTKLNKNLNDDVNIAFMATYDRNGAGPESIWAQGWNNENNFVSFRTVELLSWKYISHKYNLYQDFIYQPSNNLTISSSLKYALANHQTAYHFGYSDQISFMPDSASKFDNIDTINKYNLFPPLHTKKRYPGNTFNENEWGGHLQAKIKAMENKMIIVAGARYDYNDIYGDAINPRVGFIYKIFENKLFYKANYGTGFHPPAPRNRFGSWGGLKVNPDLESEKIQTIDFGLSSFTKKTSNEITFFKSKITNSVLQGENLPNKTIQGLEYKFNYLTSLGKIFRKFQTHINYCFILPTWNEDREDSITGRQNSNVGDIAKHKMNAIFDFCITKHVHWDIRFNYIGKRETIVTNPVKEIDPYLITNTSLQIRDLVNNSLMLYVNINNLMDIEYYHPGWDAASAGEDISKPSGGWYSSRLPQPPRNFMIGLKANL